MSKVADQPRKSSPEWGGEYSPKDESLLFALDQTERVAGRVRQYGLFAYGLTMTNVVLAATQISLHIFPSTYATLLTLLLAILAGLLLGWRDTLRRQGDALFEEIADELHWDVSREYAESNESPRADTRPALRARLVLREYSRATDMPLIKGNLGPLIYILLNFGCLLSVVLGTHFIPKY